MNNDSQYFNTQNSGYNSIPQYNNIQSPKSNKGFGKYIIIALIVIGLAVAAFFLIKNFLGNDKTEQNLNGVFDPNKPIIVKNDDKYGYITADGKIMIEPQYNSAKEFNGDYAMVGIPNPDTTSYNKTIYQIIDKKGNAKLISENYYGITNYAEYGVWVVDGVLYDSNLNRILPEGVEVQHIADGYFEFSNHVKEQSGIMDYTGKTYFTWEGSYIYADLSTNSLDPTDLYARVTKYDERDVIVSLKTGKIVYSVDNVDENHLYVEGNNVFKEYNSDYKCVKTMFFIDGKLGYSTTEDIDDIDLLDNKNQIIEIDYGYNYDELGKTQRRYYYDIKNKKMLEEKPKIEGSSSSTNIDLNELTYGYREYSCSSKYGLISGDKIIIACEYSDIEYLNENLFNYLKSKGKEIFLMKKDGKTIVMDVKNKQELATLNATYIYDYDNSTFIQAPIYGENSYSRTGYIIYNLLTGKSMEFGKDDDITIYSNYIVHAKDGKKTYYNTEFKQIYEVE